ncbi:MAG: hypothetical protein IJX00_04530 [Clostridia bacterium]|nr:hypothetical protein [Clostridia bacterium]
MKKLLIFVFSLLFSVTLVFGGTYIIVDRVAPDAVPEEEIGEVIEPKASGNWSSYTDNIAHGSGTSSDPLKIYDGTDLANVAMWINNYYKTQSGSYHNTLYYKLMNNIDLSAHYWFPIGVENKTFQSNHFKGVFDGSGFTINGLTMRVYEDDSRQYMGLFGYTEGATIKNLKIKYNLTVYAITEDGFWETESCYAGGIVGRNMGSTKLDTVTILEGSKLTYNRSWDQLPFESAYISNFVGYSSGSLDVDDCVCYGDIEVSASNQSRESKNADLYCGGLIGYSSGELDVDFTCNYGDITISQPTSTDNPHNDNYQYFHVGGIIGRSAAACNLRNVIFSGKLEQTGSLWIRSGNAAVGGLIGKHSGSQGLYIYCGINYSDISINEAHIMCVGGLVGSCDTSGNLKIEGAANWGNLALRLTKEENSAGGFGGIVGQTASNYSYITECINYGDVWFSTASYQVKFVGGILGYSLDDDGADHGRGYISNCINFGKIGSSDSDVICVGGIAGELTEVDLSWKNWDNGKLGYSWVYVYEGVHVRNCINMGMVYGGSSVGQIVGYLYDDLFSNNYMSDKSTRPAVGNNSSLTATKKSLSAVCNGTFLSTTGNWTNTVNVRMSSVYYSGDYSSTYYYILLTQLPHQYYTSSQWYNKVGVYSGSLPTLIPTSACNVARGKVTAYWDKPGSTNNSNVEDVSTLYARKHGGSASGWNNSTSTINFRYLRGASYTGDRYLEAMKVVTTNTDNFTARGFVINSGHDATKNQQGLDIYGTYTSGATNYLQFRGFTDSVATTIQLKFYYDAVGKSLANSSGTPVSSKKKDIAQSASDTTEYNVLTPKLKKNSRTNNYTFYYNDTVGFEVTPSFGYRFAGLLAGDSATLSSSNAVTKITNTALGKYVTGTTGGFTYTYKQKYFVWQFDKVEYTLAFVDSQSTSGASPKIAEEESDKTPKKLSDSVQTDYSTTMKFVVTGGYVQASDNNDLSLENIAYGYRYNIKCGFSTGWASTNSYSNLLSNNLGKVDLHMDELTRYLSSVSGAINQNKIYVYVSKTAIELDVTLHNIVQMYNQHQNTQSANHIYYINNYDGMPAFSNSTKKSVGGESFFYNSDGSRVDTVTFSRDCSEDSNWRVSLKDSEYKTGSRRLYLLSKDGYIVYGQENALKTVGIRVLYSKLNNGVVETVDYPEAFSSVGLNVAMSGEGGDLLAVFHAIVKKVCKYSSEHVITNENQGVDYLEDNGIHIYVPYVLQDYILDVGIQEISGNSMPSSEVKYYKYGATVPANPSTAVSVITDSATADAVNVKVLYYYAPVTLKAKDFFANTEKAYKFVGWYLRDGEDSYRLLSTKTEYKFFVDPSLTKALAFAGGDGLRIVAKYNASAKTSGASLPMVGKSYTLASTDALKLFSEMVAGGQSFEGRIVKLTANLTFEDDEVFTPIGTKQTPFKGTFDGQNYTISNINFGETNTQKGVGLFGYVENATIKNVTVANSRVKGFSYVGMIAGYAVNTKFENVHANECILETANISTYNIYAEIMEGNKVVYPIDDAERGSSLNYEELEGESDFENEIEKRECFSSLIGYAKGCKLFMTSVRSSDASNFLIKLENTLFFDEDDDVKSGFYFGYLIGKAEDGTTIDQSYVDAQKAYDGIPLHNGASLSNCYYRYRSPGTTKEVFYKNTSTQYAKADLKNHPNIWLEINGRWVLQIFYWN